MHDDVCIMSMTTSIVYINAIRQSQYRIPMSTFKLNKKNVKVNADVKYVLTSTINIKCES